MWLGLTHQVRACSVRYIQYTFLFSLHIIEAKTTVILRCKRERPPHTYHIFLLVGEIDLHAGFVGLKRLFWRRVAVRRGRLISLRGTDSLHYYSRLGLVCGLRRVERHTVLNCSAVSPCAVHTEGHVERKGCVRRVSECVAAPPS